MSEAEKSPSTGVVHSSWEQLCKDIDCESAVVNAGWALCEELFSKHDKLRGGGFGGGGGGGLVIAPCLLALTRRASPHRKTSRVSWHPSPSLLASK